MALYPMFADLGGRPCVVVGGGPVAEGKVHGLLAAGAAVTVVSPTLTEALDAAAAGGTVFLDEIGDIPPETQVRLLRVIQERESTPLGDTAPELRGEVTIAAHRRKPARASGIYAVDHFLIRGCYNRFIESLLALRTFRRGA